LIRANIPIGAALEHASRLLHLAKKFTLDGAIEPDAGRYAWASHYLGEMGKALMHDVHTVVFSVACH
jgi:hypothetical protein